MDEEGLQACWRDETRRRTSRGGIPNRLPRRYRRGRPIARKISHVLILGSSGRKRQRRDDSRRGDAATPVSRGRAAVVPNEGGCRNSFRRGPVSLPTPPWRSVLGHTETHSRGEANLPPHDEVAKAADVREVEDVITTDRQGLALHCKQTNQK